VTGRLDPVPSRILAGLSSSDRPLPSSVIREVAMVRRYDDEVEVRALAGPLAQEPEAFLWRGRVYRVREVLGHWHERRSWWTEPAARAVHGEEGTDGGTATATATVSVPGADREVWRVEASAGRSASSGVYDLCRHEESGPSWRLLRVAD